MKKMLLVIATLCLFSTLSCGEDIPEDHTVLMNSVLRKEFKVDQPEAIDRLSGGFSSPGLYKIMVAGKAYVVRFSNKLRSLPDRERELEAMLISAERGVAPKVFYGDAQEGIIIMDYIDAPRGVERVNPLTDDSLKAFAASLRTLHEGPSFKEHLSVFDVARYFETAMKGERPSTLVRGSKLLNELQTQLNDNLLSKPCHNDLNPNNTLYSNGRVFLIDWESASQGDPFFDLATPVVLYTMNQAQEQTLLHAYFGRQATPNELAKFEKMKGVASIYYGFALIMVSQMQGFDFLSEHEIEKLPRPNQLPSVNVAKGPKGIQEVGFAFLREAVHD